MANVGNNTGGGLKVSIGLITLIFGVILQTIIFTAKFTTVSNNQAHMMQQVAETKFIVGNIQDGQRDNTDRIVKHETWDQLKTEAIEKELADLRKEVDDLKGRRR